MGPVNILAHTLNKALVNKDLFQCSHRLEKYLNIQDCLEKSLKIKFEIEKYLKNTERH